ncbi:hypothetical protein [Kitasatospora purpeofusca]|uniref:hypothetical protein n=1 Tax=Kitasatospora purpeofusca TaxID=67352 RepID=UPI0036A6E61D
MMHAAYSPPLWSVAASVRKRYLSGRKRELVADSADWNAIRLADDACHMSDYGKQPDGEEWF